jgi:hypothetical protein
MRRLHIAAIATLALLLPACSGTITRVSTQPEGAKLVFVESNLEYVTPCDIYDADVDEEITISLPGFESFHGPITDMQQISAGNYFWKLRKIR